MAPSTRSPLSTAPPGPTPQLDDGFDEIIDLTDRRRVLLRALFGVVVPPDAADAVFTGGCQGADGLSPRRR
jgi:hypothetical protein